MNEEIAKALRELRQGLPGAWEHLCSEVVLMGWFNTVISLILGLLLAWGAVRCGKLANQAKEGSDMETVTVVGVVVCAGLSILLIVLSISSLERVLAPSVWLLKTVS